MLSDEPYIWNEVVDEDLIASSYFEPGLFAGIFSRVGHQYECVKSDFNKVLYFAEVQFDKFDERIRGNRKQELYTCRGTYGKSEKFYSYEEAKNWCIKYMNGKRDEATQAYFFHVNRYPDLINDVFKNHHLFKSGKKKRSLLRKRKV